MAKTVLIEKFIRRKNQMGVKYLVEETTTGEVRRTDILINPDENPTVYGEQFAEDIFAAGDVVSGGERTFEALREEAIREVHERAIFTIKQGIKNDETLETIIDNIITVYQDAGETRVLNILTELYQTWNAGTANKQNQFVIFMLFVLTALR